MASRASSADSSHGGSGFAASSLGAPDTRGADSFLDSVLGERGPLPARNLSRWMGWRLRLLVISALLGCLGLFLLAREMAAAPYIDASWRANAQGRIELTATGEPELRSRIGQTLTGLASGPTSVELPDALALQRSSRWILDDSQRARHLVLHEQIAGLLAQPTLRLTFDDGSAVTLAPHPRGFVSLPPTYWLLSAFALALYLVAMVVLMAKPNLRNLVYALLTVPQAGTLVLIAVESTLSLSLPQPFPRLDMGLRLAFDLMTAAGIVSAASLHPRKLPGSGLIILAAWLLAAAMLFAEQTGRLAHAWWWAQGAVVFYGLVTIALMTWSYRLEPHPFATVLRRFGVVTLCTWLLLTFGLAAADGGYVGAQNTIASIGPMIWYVFFGSLLLLVPFLSRSQQIMREFSLLAAVSTVATSLDLLFVAVFSLGQFASLTLSLFISLAVYSGARQWILNQLLGSSMVTTERMFEQLYRIAREVEAHPERTATLLSQLLRELFEPMEVVVVERKLSRSRVALDGSTLLVPVPVLSGQPNGTAGAIAIRFAWRGRRLFVAEDARLTDRVVEQLRRAVAFDKAVEQGRSEERMRIAQDLHDDIGARLLTLMYKAQSPEMEDYVRHTLQDLKTLTRGLAAPNHRLSHAAAEWKSDLTQRLTAAHIELRWSFVFDDDVLLSVVQWSALTRVMRELVSNTIAHAQATQVSIDFDLSDDILTLGVVDDGVGSNPRAWSHGLGLGGVRKRVKQLGGEVEWREVLPSGIGCRVVIREFSARV